MTVAPSFIGTFLVANSTPIVGPLVFGNVFFKYLLSRQVLPTETSPIRMTIEGKGVRNWFLSKLTFV